MENTFGFVQTTLRFWKRKFFPLILVLKKHAFKYIVSLKYIWHRKSKNVKNCDACTQKSCCTFPKTSLVHLYCACCDRLCRTLFCAKYRTHLQTDLCNILFMWTQNSWQYKTLQDLQHLEDLVVSEDTSLSFLDVGVKIFDFNMWGECALNFSSPGFSLENFQKFNAYICWVEIKNECKVLDHGCLNILSTLKNLKLKLSSMLKLKFSSMSKLETDLLIFQF